MAQYLVTASAYVDGVHLAAEASLVNPLVIEVRDDLVPSRKWEPMDKAAQEALAKIGIKKQIAHAPEAPPEKPAAATNAEMNEQRAGKVVGRLSDKSPV